MKLTNVGNRITTFKCLGFHTESPPDDSMLTFLIVLHISFSSGLSGGSAYSNTPFPSSQTYLVVGEDRVILVPHVLSARYENTVTPIKNTAKFTRF